MSWSWSHTGEAYEAARRNLGRLPRETLLDIAAEWRAFQPDADDADGEGFSTSAFKGARAMLVRDHVPADVLADDIWGHAEGFATCDTGGWNAWMCPYGCGPHTVAFSDGKDAD